MMGLAGCGVGADEAYDGQTLVSASGEALTAAPEGSPLVGPSATPAIPQPTVTTSPSTIRNPGTVALPQDPIPVYEGRPAPVR